MSISVVILAAGQGTRMRSDLPKVLQPLAGKPLLEHVLNAAQDLNAEQDAGARRSGSVGGQGWPPQV